jgi:hypothetical protein
MAGEGLDAGPVQEPGGRHVLADALGDDPADDAAQPGVDADDPVPALEAGDLDLVRAHEPGAVVDLPSRPPFRSRRVPPTIRERCSTVGGAVAAIAQNLVPTGRAGPPG